MTSGPRTALDTLGGLEGDASVHDIAQGWLRVGGDQGVLVDTLFVLADEHLGFGQTQAATGQPNWIELSKVVALDAIEGLPYPLVAVEVQIAGGIAMLVGWPDEFCDQVVEVLTRSVQRARDAQKSAESDVERLPPEFADPAGSAEHADVAEIEAMSPSSWVEADVDGTPNVAGSPQVTEPAAATEPPEADASPWDRSPWATEPVQEFPVTDTLVTSDDAGFVPDSGFVPDAELGAEAGFMAEIEPEVVSEPTPPAGFQPLFDAGGTERDELVEAFFNPDDVAPYDESTSADAEHSGEDDADPAAWAAPPESDHVDAPEQQAPPRTTPAAFASRSISWPEPYRPTTFLGDHPDHTRRRKNVSLGFSPAGITAASTGFNAWKVHLQWDDVRTLEFEGADEIKFTHNHRIDMNGTAVIITLTDNSTMVFEIRSRRPAMVRSTMAPIVNALASHRAHLAGSDDASGHGATFTF